MFRGLTDIERKELLSRYRTLLKSCKPLTDADDKKQIRKAFNLAVEAHKDMRRRSGEPYIFHPVEVAIIASSEIGLGATSIVCALLHDVVEDTDYTIEDIKAMFGEKVASIIDGLTKISGIIDKSNLEEKPDLSHSMQAENYRKILLTMAEDVRVILIKLADRLHNMRTLEFMPSEKRLKIASETAFLYAPLAHRLGLYTIKSEMEDLVLRYTDPNIYQSITNKLIESDEERNKFIKNFIEPISVALSNAGLKFDIVGRTKSINSIWKKMLKKNIPFEEVYDVFAIRIIIDSDVENERLDCWKAYSVVTQVYTPNPERLRDWISVPKANGYEALHTTVMSNTGKWVEVQIRSTRMNEIAEKGYAAHWKYKEDKKGIENSLDDWLKRIRELLQRPESNAIDFLDDFKLTLFADEIYVFTRSGELRNLPKNSTVLDFAYSIHSDIGNKCIGAKVNHKLVALSHVLSSGDQIEVLTSEKQSPKEEWLNIVISAKAKSQIKMAVKEDKKRSAERGKEIISRMFNQVRLPSDEKKIEEFAKYLNINDVNELYLDAFSGKIDIKTVKAFSTINEKSGWLNYLRAPFAKGKHANAQNKQIRKKRAKKLELDVENQVSFVIADCCNPIPGDEVVGFVLSENSLEIHRANCANAVRMNARYGDRIRNVQWDDSKQITFKTAVRLSGIDKIGILRDIIRILSEENNLNISSVMLETKNEIFEGKITLYVNNTEHLKNLINQIKKVDGVERVSRLRLTEAM
ncbi:MAG: bifunctional (p)ppGpp synthetase/guanosine-3',5'-bis(diphosphate) 3'-pyrophosphohydrolase [Bacteroidales bacterium]|nr:bifunctional (p)ppGpp synthetase/guanosine-3',5'-bis(diphosphate) 3'-pyrophosphohydrolase [Bacteroidales bacterium]